LQAREIPVTESSDEVEEIDDGTDLNMMCCSITEVEPVSHGDLVLQIHEHLVVIPVQLLGLPTSV